MNNTLIEIPGLDVFKPQPGLTSFPETTLSPDGVEIAEFPTGHISQVVAYFTVTAPATLGIEFSPDGENYYPKMVISGSILKPFRPQAPLGKSVLEFPACANACKLIAYGEEGNISVKVMLGRM